jgi:hypothetical protein
MNPFAMIHAISNGMTLDEAKRNVPLMTGLEYDRWFHTLAGASGAFSCVGNERASGICNQLADHIDAISQKEKVTA